jgi:uncharacterized protein YigE (DUF2233 family)
MRRLMQLAFVACACVFVPSTVAHPWRSTSPCKLQTFEGARFTVCSDSDGEMNIEIYSTAPNGQTLRGFRDFERAYPKEARYVRYGMNAGMFDAEGRPIGLLIQRAKVKRPLNRRSGWGNFHLKPNGVFFLGMRNGKNGAFVVPTEAFDAKDVQEATQSGPLLLIDGKLHPAIQHDGESRYIRNAVGIAPNGEPSFVISEDPVSFGKLARFFRDELRSKNALYLDGSVSSLWDPEKNRRDERRRIGPVIIAFEFPE